ncbi:Uncharacterized protein HA466_0298630 [Hirschfeldia incana]|nr:Uncharacterized protein HA466_0298630 [Hirschfeldia incana]
MDFRSRRVQFLLFAIGIVALSITAEKCRELVGIEAASKSGQFTFLNCFDMSSGTVACAVKEGVKLYFYSIRSIHVEKARNVAIEKALHEALVKGMAANEAAKDAQNAGAKAAKLATRQAKRIIRTDRSCRVGLLRGALLRRDVNGRVLAWVRDFGRCLCREGMWRAEVWEVWLSCGESLGELDRC